MKKRPWHLCLYFCVLCSLLIGCSNTEVQESTKVASEKTQEPIMRSSNDYEYLLFEDGTAELIRYKGSDNALAIPEKLEGHLLVNIEDEAFKNNWRLSSVTIPDNVLNIGANPFKGCDNLLTINVSPSHPTLATIDGVLFYKPDKKLICYPQKFSSDNYAIPQGIEIIGDSAFYECTSLKTITFPDSITEIGDSAFYKCEELIKLNIPNNTIRIGSNAFYDCHNLTSILIPDSVLTIGDSAFAKCYTITEITIPDSVTDIGSNPFWGCKREAIKVSENHPILEVNNGVLFSKLEKRLICPISIDIEEGKPYSIPQGIEIIDNYAFYKWAMSNGIIIPDSVRTIGNSAFYDCNFKSMEIPSSVTYIGDEAFAYSSLEKIIIADGVTSIGDKAFYSCDDLTSAVIPDSVKHIGALAFYDYNLGIFKDVVNNNVVLTVGINSYAEQYARKNEIHYTHPTYAESDTSWLTK